MGYVHTVYQDTQQRPIPSELWALITMDFKKLIENLPDQVDGKPLRIAYEHDCPGLPPQVDAETIRFNGTGPIHLDLGHETFVLDRTGECSFTKTNQKPYDLVVCATLFLAFVHAEDYVRLKSDGDLVDWMPALRLIAKVFGPQCLAELPATIDPGVALEFLDKRLGDPEHSNHWDYYGQRKEDILAAAAELLELQVQVASMSPTLSTSGPDLEPTLSP